MAIDYSQLIPNNVDLASDRRLQRALENWQPRFRDWWKDMGPDGTHPSPSGREKVAQMLLKFFESLRRQNKRLLMPS